MRLSENDRMQTSRSEREAAIKVKSRNKGCVTIESAVGEGCIYRQQPGQRFPPRSGQKEEEAEEECSPMVLQLHDMPLPRG